MATTCLKLAPLFPSSKVELDSQDGDKAAFISALVDTGFTTDEKLLTNFSVQQGPPRRQLQGRPRIHARRLP
jgi:hypothetical protein